MHFFLPNQIYCICSTYFMSCSTHCKWNLYDLLNSFWFSQIIFSCKTICSTHFMIWFSHFELINSFWADQLILSFSTHFELLRLLLFPQLVCIDFYYKIHGFNKFLAHKKANYVQNISKWCISFCQIKFIAFAQLILWVAQHIANEIYMICSTHFDFLKLFLVAKRFKEENKLQNISKSCI
jgi:hypothetical protein